MTLGVSNTRVEKVSRTASLCVWMRAQAAGRMEASEVQGGRNRSVRGDDVAWVGNDDPGPAMNAFRRSLDALMLHLMDAVPELEEVPLVRDKAMVTVYPGNGARYLGKIHKVGVVALLRVAAENRGML